MERSEETLLPEPKRIDMLRIATTLGTLFAILLLVVYALRRHFRIVEIMVGWQEEKVAKE